MHFIYFAGPKSREFSFINYLAIRSAAEIQKPEKIYLYCNQEPSANPYWEAIRQYVEMVHMEAPTSFEGVNLFDWPQYQADVVRLQKLYEVGGIYLDTDCIMLKPLDDLLHHECVMSGFAGNTDTHPKHKVQSFSAATILAKPRADFLKIWIQRLADGLSRGIWAWHVVDLPVQIYKENPKMLTLLDMEAFLPFDFNDRGIFDPSRIEDCLKSIDGSYMVHMWDSVWQDTLRKINRDYLATVDNAFTRLFAKYKD